MENNIRVVEDWKNLKTWNWNGNWNEMKKGFSLKGTIKFKEWKLEEWSLKKNKNGHTLYLPSSIE